MMIDSEKGPLNMHLREDNLHTKDDLNREIELPTNKEVVWMVEYAYGNLNEEEMKQLEDESDKEEYLKITLQEILNEKERLGFTNTKEHYLLMENERKRFREKSMKTIDKVKKTSNKKNNEATR